MKRHLGVTILLLLTIVPCVTHAQWTFDVTSVEAYINDHKEQRSLLLARNTLEASNKLLHNYSMKETVGFKDLNADLDKYTRAFNVIDVMYQSLRTVLNVVNTFGNVGDRINDYKQLLEDFNSQVVKRKGINAADTILLGICYRAIQNIANDGEQLYLSVNDLVLYTTCTAACSTHELLMVLNSISNSLDDIEHHLNKAYFESWRYVQVRMGYWKEKVYRTKSKSEIIDGAFGRWRMSGKLNTE